MKKQDTPRVQNHWYLNCTVLQETEKREERRDPDQITLPNKTWEFDLRETATLHHHYYLKTVPF